jgi:signal peptidase II
MTEPSAAPPPDPPHASASPPKGRVFRVIATMLVLLTVDQLTKWIAVETLRGRPRMTYFFDTFRLVYAENTGVFLGLGQNLPEFVRFGFFTVAVGAVLVVMLFQTVRAPPSDNWIVIALTLIVSGGFGNLIDRILHDGVVIDFMNMGIGGLRTGIFNVADMSITAGVFIFLGGEIVRSRHHKRDREKSETAVSGKQ